MIVPKLKANNGDKGATHYQAFYFPPELKVPSPSVGAFKHMDCSSSAVLLTTLLKYLPLNFIEDYVAHRGQIVGSVPFLHTVPQVKTQRRAG